MMAFTEAGGANKQLPSNKAREMCLPVQEIKIYSHSGALKQATHEVMYTCTEVHGVNKQLPNNTELGKCASLSKNL